MNAATKLHFYPAGGFSNPGYNKTVECPTAGVDANCDGDKIEACILKEYCDGVSCKPAEQLKLATFLDCFENEHGSAMSAADGCLKSSGFSVSRVRACYDGAAKEVAWTIFHISILREYLHADLQVPGFEDMERLVDDFVFLTFLLGNDFIPHLPALDIGEGCFDLLFKEYRKALLISGDYLTKDGELTSPVYLETFLRLDFPDTFCFF